MMGMVGGADFIERKETTGRFIDRSHPTEVIKLDQYLLVHSKLACPCKFSGTNGSLHKLHYLT